MPTAPGLGTARSHQQNSFRSKQAQLKSFNEALETLAWIHHRHVEELEVRVAALSELSGIMHLPPEGKEPPSWPQPPSIRSIRAADVSRRVTAAPPLSPARPCLQIRKPATPRFDIEPQDVGPPAEDLPPDYASSLCLLSGSHDHDGSDATEEQRNSDGKLKSAKTSRAGHREMYQAHECWDWGGDVEKMSFDQYQQSLEGFHERVIKTLTSNNLASLGVGTPASRWYIHPQSLQRAAWDVMGMCLVIYDFILLPMQAFELQQSDPLVVMEWLSAAFWTLDMMVNFRTGVYDSNATLHFNTKHIARQYARSWLLLDVTVVIASWLNIGLGSSVSVLNSASTLRVFRVVRFVKLIRALKVFQSIREHVSTYSTSTSLLQLTGIVQRLWSLLLVNHFVACCWYWIGDGSSHGWVQVKSESLRNRKLVNDIAYWYFTSLHWSISQFVGGMEVSPTSLPERMYAVVILFVALLMASTLVSSITTMMVEVESAYREQKETHEALRDFLQAYAIDKDLCVLAKTEIDKRWRSGNHHQNQAKLFELMPSKLRITLLVEIRLKVIQYQWIFTAMLSVTRELTTRVCHLAMADVPVQAGEYVFAGNDLCEKMYFVLRGQLQYQEDDPGRQLTEQASHESTQSQGIASVFKNDAVSEAALWTTWHHIGELRSSHPESKLVGLEASTFMRMTSSTTSLRDILHPYALHFVTLMNQHGCTDLGLETPEAKAKRTRAHFARTPFFMFAPSVESHSSAELPTTAAQLW